MMQDVRENQKTRRVPPPARIRNACNGCCAAKVKCSGERSGCNRCKTTGTSCVYLESRVGRVPGIRARKKILRNQTQSRNVSSVSSSSATSSIEVGLQDMSAAGENAVIWSNDWQIQPIDADTIIASFPDESQADNDNHRVETTEAHATVTDVPSMFSNDVTNVSSVSLDYGNSLMIPFSNTLLTESDGTTSCYSAGEGRNLDRCTLTSLAKLDSECVQECCHIIADLEVYLGSQLSDFKIILGIVRQVFERINDLITRQQSSGNPRCLMLFTTILYQSLALIQVCLTNILSDKNTVPRHGSLGPSISLGLGEFSTRAEELSNFCVQTLLKETDQGLAVIQRMKDLSSAMLGMPEVDPLIETKAKASMDCFTGLEMDFRALQARSQRTM